jgi:AmmeMemoRadiSam system protein A
MEMSDEEHLSESERGILLRKARETIETYAKAGEKPEASEEDEKTPALESSLGAFVSLHKKGQLRGCIGIFEGHGSLVNTIQDMAVSAGWKDPRFPSLSEKELEDVDIEISVLTPRRKIKDVSEIEVGKHGIYITKGLNKGVLLPQVATEHGWDRDTFLEHTCIKAGLPDDAWKDPETIIEVFSADVFGEKEKK